MIFRLEFVAPTTYYALVDAESESAARQAWIDQDIHESHPVDDPSEAPHDHHEARLILVEPYDDDEED